MFYKNGFGNAQERNTDKEQLTAIKELANVNYFTYEYLAKRPKDTAARNVLDKYEALIYDLAMILDIEFTGVPSSTPMGGN